jgi:DHA2 family methylenomycin A resistance protein-like MFS transporter
MSNLTDTPAAEPSVDARRWTLVATSLGFSVVQLDVSIVNVAIKSIGAGLGGGVSGLQWVVNAYTIAFAACILTAGSIADRIGARRLFVGGFVLFMVASAVCGVAPDLGVLIGARAVQGLAAALLVPSSLALLSHAYTDARARTHAVGIYLAGASSALSGGPLIGGALIALIGWRAIFFINIPVALCGIFLTLRFANETTRSAGRGVDVPGQLTAILTLVLLVGSTIEGGVHGFAATDVLAGYAAAVVCGCAFVWFEARSGSPMLPLSLFRSRTFSVCSVAGLLINTAFYGLIFVISLFFQRVQGLSPLMTGLALAPVMIGITVSNVLSGRMQERFGPTRVLTLGAAVQAAACAGLLGIGAGTSYGAIVVQLTALGVGGGLVVPTVTAQLLGSVDRRRSGVAGGTLNTLRQTGSAVGVALFGSLLAGSGGFVSGAHASFAIAIGLGLGIVALAPLMRSGRSDRRSQAGNERGRAGS